MAALLIPLVLIAAANSAPVLLRNALGDRLARPIDNGLVLGDGRPLFGRSKTWRGLAGGTLAAAAVAPLCGLPFTMGAAAGAAALCGDLVASFCKRRLGVAASGRAPVLDSVPEALLPTLVLRSELELSWFAVGLIVVLFTLVVRVSSPLLYRLHIRRQPW